MKNAILILTLIFSSCAGASDYLFVNSSFKSDKSWTSFSKSDEMNVRHLIQQLAKSKTGKELLLKAKKKAAERGETLLDIIKVGSGSLTDTTLIRRFSKDHPEHVVYESKSVVYLNQSLSQFDALLDLAHELTHYNYRKDFNPYKLNFTMAQFIKNTIEAEGGEVHAFVKECSVLRELFPSQYSTKKNCMDILDGGSISFKKGIELFYQVGPLYKDFAYLLNKTGLSTEDLPMLSQDSISFVSSAYGVPYPIAAFKEYRSVLKKVCENDERRVAYMKRNNRSPASVEFNKLITSYESKCRNVTFYSSR